MTLTPIVAGVAAAPGAHTPPAASTPPPPQPVVGCSPGSEEMVARLARELTVPTGGWVDLLHLAAHLEARGLTDDAAQSSYGSPDVFALAERVARIPPAADASPPTPQPDTVRPRAPRAMWLHGIIYLLPAAALPAALVGLGARDATVALGGGGALGWVWVGCTAPVAFNLRGMQREQAATRWMLQVTCIGLVLAALASLVSALLMPQHWWIVAGLVFSMATFQMATAHEFFHGRRPLVPLVMAPAVVLGVLHLASGQRAGLRILVTGTLFACCLILIGSALSLGVRDVRRGRARPDSPEHVGSPAIWSVARHLQVCVLTVVSAAFLLGTQLSFLRTTPDLGVTMAGLLVAMGVVEWRALALADGARRLLDASTDIAAFHRSLARRVLGELLVTVAVASLGSIIVAWIVIRTIGLTRAGVLALVAASLLAGVYLLTFMLTNAGRVTTLILAFGGASLMTLLVPALTVLSVAASFLASSILLVILLWHSVLELPARSFQ